MSVSDKNNTLDTSLARLEECLETPIVPGELPTWAGQTSQALAETGEHMRRHIQTEHEEVFAQIATEDAELLRRVELLQQEDDELLAMHQKLLDRADQTRLTSV